MARSQANLQFTIFEGLAGLSPSAKLLYIALLVEPTVNQAGVGALRPSRWARQTGLSRTRTDRALTELDAAEFALSDRDTEELLIRTFIRNDRVAHKPNVLWAACRAAPLVRSPRLRAVLAAELRKLPPKPADKIGQNGRMFVHPDPHATADVIDPGTVRERFENGSGTLPEPFPNRSENRTIREPFSNHSRTTGGGGGGSTSSPHPSVGGVVGFAARPKTPRTSHDTGNAGTRIPDDFAVTAEMVAWARNHAPHVNGRVETEQFVDYWRAKTGRDATKRDWTATWRRWMRKAERDATTHQPRPPARSTADDKIRALQALKNQPEQQQQSDLPPGHQP